MGGRAGLAAHRHPNRSLQRDLPRQRQDPIPPVRQPLYQLRRAVRCLGEQCPRRGVRPAPCLCRGRSRVCWSTRRAQPRDGGRQLRYRTRYSQHQRRRIGRAERRHPHGQLLNRRGFLQLQFASCRGRRLGGVERRVGHGQLRHRHGRGHLRQPWRLGGKRGRHGGGDGQLLGHGDQRHRRRGAIDQPRDRLHPIDVAYAYQCRRHLRRVGRLDGGRFGHRRRRSVGLWHYRSVSGAELPANRGRADCTVR